MKFHKIRSYAKINLSLGVLGKLKSRIHKIESIVSFIDLHDEIFIREHKMVLMFFDTTSSIGYFKLN